MDRARYATSHPRARSGGGAHGTGGTRGAGADGTSRSHVTPSVIARAGTTNVVYVLGTTGCAATTCVRMYRSNVEGTSFTRVTPPPVKVEPGAYAPTSLARLDFANERDGFALVSYGDFGMTLYATSDGAHTWRVVQREDEGQIRVFVSDTQIFVSSVHCAPRTMNCTQWVTRRSGLAAATWSLVPRLWTTGTGPTDVYYGPEIAALGRTVWELETGPDVLWTSHDDGRTFVRSSLTFPQLVSVSGCSLYPMSALALWAECPTGLEVSFWHTSDGGAVWSPVSQGQFSGTGGGAFAPVTSSVAYLDYGAALGRENVVRLSDAGRHAQSVSELSCTEAWMLFTTVARGLAVCDKNLTSNLLERTSNGGATWSPVELARG